MHLQPSLPRESVSVQKQQHEGRHEQQRYVYREPCRAYVGVFLLYCQPVVQLQRVLRVAHHYFRCAHVHYVVLERVVACVAFRQVVVRTLVVALPHVVLAQVAVAYVGHVEVHRGRYPLVGQYAAYCCGVAGLQRERDHDCMAVVQCRLVAYLVEEGVDFVHQPPCLLLLSEVHFHVGHVYLAYVHLVAVVHSVRLEKLLHSRKHGFRATVVARIVVVIAVVRKEVQLHVERHQPEVAVGYAVATERRIEVSEVKVYPSEPHVQAYVVLVGQFQRVRKEQCAPVPPRGARHVVGRHVRVAQVGAHVGQVAFAVAARQLSAGFVVGVDCLGRREV